MTHVDQQRTVPAHRGRDPVFRSVVLCIADTRGLDARGSGGTLGDATRHPTPFSSRGSDPDRPAGPRRRASDPPLLA
jgi:hypothetical protein